MSSLETKRWSDKVFFDNFIKPEVKYKRPNLSAAVKICATACSVIFGTNAINDVRPLANIFLGTLSCLKSDNEYVLDDDLFVENGQDFIYTSTPYININHYQFHIFKPDTPQLINVKDPEGSMITLNSKEIIKKIVKLATILGVKLRGKNLPNSDLFWQQKDANLLQEACNIIGYYVMILLRLIGKNDENVYKLLPGSFIAKFSKHFASSTILDKLFVPPSFQGFQCLNLVMDKNPDTMLAFCIYSSFCGNEILRDFRLDICKSACLTSLSEAGLPLIKWSFEAAKSQKLNLVNFLKDTRCDWSATSVSNAVRFVDEFTDQYSWPWAHYFYQDCMRAMSTDGNLQFIVFCASICCNGNRNSAIMRTPLLLKARKQSATVFDYFFQLGEVYLKRVAERKVQINYNYFSTIDIFMSKYRPKV